MEKIRKATSGIKRLAWDVLGSTETLYFFILNIIGGCSILVYGISWNAVLGVIGLAALIAALLGTIIKLCDRFNKKVKKVVFCLISIMLNLLLCADLFLVFTFHKPFDQDMVDILAETNTREATEFIITYIPLLKAVVALTIIVTINYFLYLASKWLKSRAQIAIFSVCSFSVVLGIVLLAFSSYNYILYRNGNALPQLSSLTRVTHAFLILNNRLGDIQSLIDVCDDPNLVNGWDNNDSTVYVLVIGESASVYHSGLYGYETETTPKLTSRKEKGELCVFIDAVSIDDHTHTAVKSIFSLSPRNNGFKDYALFPAVFKKADYTTHLFDNQYFCGNGISFLSNPQLSNIMFDYRNATGFAFDGEMLQTIEAPDSRALIVIHLMGQHYTYKDRYPKDFKSLQMQDYRNLEDSENLQTILAYDTSVMYTDSILDAFIDKLEDKNACLIYLSDHGEEVFEYGDFNVHGNAARSPGLKNQIRVPLCIWGSKQFRESDNWQNIIAAKERKVTTDDISHVLLDLAKIKTAQWDATRSFINKDYEERHRIVLNSIDYDNLQ